MATIIPTETREQLVLILTYYFEIIPHWLISPFFTCLVYLHQFSIFPFPCNFSSISPFSLLFSSRPSSISLFSFPPLAQCPSVPSYLPVLPSLVHLPVLPSPYLHVLPSHHISLPFRPIISPCPPVPRSPSCPSFPLLLHFFPSHHISMSFRPIISPCPSAPSYLHVLPSHHISMSFCPIISPCLSFPSCSMSFRFHVSPSLPVPFYLLSPLYFFSLQSPTASVSLAHSAVVQALS